METTYIVRELIEEDLLQKFFLETLSYLSEMGNIPPEKLLETFQRMKRNDDNTIFMAITNEGKVIGALTLLIEQKFIHRCGKVGHIEDVVVHGDYRGQDIARNLIKKAIEVSKKEKCYKVILNCKEELVPFYEMFGFGKHEIEMRLNIH